LDAEELLAKLKEQRVNDFQTYTEEAVKEGAADEERVLLDLDDGTLTTNLGVPMIVVGTKDDTVEFLAQENDYRQEHFDFMQLNIRKFCLAHGAALLYTGKSQKTSGIFYRYLMRLAFGFPCHAAACIAETDGLFIPSGWDDQTKIAVLTESFTTIKAEQGYDEVIKDMDVRSSAAGAREAVAEDEQAFLDKQRQLLSRSEPTEGGESKPRPTRALTGDGAPAAREPSAATRAGSGSERAARTERRPVSVQGATDRAARVRPSPTAAGSPAAGAAGSPAGTPGAPGAGGAQNADVLANFFNSLLGNNAAGAPGAPAGGSRPARADAAKELSKMQGKPE
jgi:dynein light intermediate chain 1